MLTSGKDGGFLQQSSAAAEEEISSAAYSGTFSDIEIKSIYLIGCLVFSAFFMLLVYSELRFRCRRRFYNQCLNEVVDAPAALKGEYEGKLVFLVGKLQVASPSYLSDPLLPFFEVTGTALLKRQVEMLQWCKDCKGAMELKWSSVEIGSKSTQHSNPPWDPLLRNKILSEENEVFVYPFKLSKDIIKMLPLTGCLKAISPFDIQRNVKGYKVTVDSTYYYLSKNEGSCPGVGDYRIKYYYMELGTHVTVLGEYRQGVIGKYKNSLLFADNGFISVNSIFEKYIGEIELKNNLIRAFSVLGTIAGVVLATTAV